MLQRIYILFLSLICALSLSAQTLSDSARISLLTCTPGNYVYSQYGHTAIRVVDPAHNMDITFNYGIFSFDTEDFYLKFVRGETDYQLGYEDTPSFLWSSAYIGRTTYEQPLNLTAAQRQALFDALMVNYRPENRFYRYNFVFDNCATRPYVLLRDITHMHAVAKDTIQQTETYRHLISHYSQANAWQDFGVNLIFGKDADKVMTTEERLFLPEELMRYVAHATLEDGTPLTDAEEVAPFVIDETPWYLSPYLVVALLSLFLVVISHIDLRKRRISWWVDALLFFIYGILGCISFFLTFCSLHPLVGENYNLLFYSPLMLIPFILILFPKGREWLLRGGLIISLYFYAALLTRIFCGQAWHWLLLVSIIHYLRIRMVWYRNTFIQLAPSHSPHRGRTHCGLLVLLLSLLAFSPAVYAQQGPRLTVVVCVNGLNETALQSVRNFLPAGGLRTIDEEAHESSLSFPQLVYGGSETLATLCTGVTPSTHGVAADTYFDRSSRMAASTFLDAQASGIGTQLTVSPAALLSPTFSDEFRMLHPSDNSKIYAVGITPENTLLLAGHAANACTWIESTTLRWCTTSYYAEGLPSAADKMNMLGQLPTLALTPWESKMDMNMYIQPSARERKKKGFEYDVNKVFTQSPAANKAVIELALALQEDKQLGKDIHGDLLSIELNVVSPMATSDLLRSAEQEDMYLGLNQDLGFLMEQLTKRVGKDNLRIVLFGKPAWGQGAEVFERANLHVNYFNIDRAAALINTYLMALYGHERWIDGGYMQSIYLNRTLIEQKRMSLTDLQQQVSNFLLEFEGTQQAFPVHQTPQATDLAQTVNKHCFGDVIFTLQPLWLLGESSEKRQDKIVEEHPTSPLFIWTTERMSVPADKLSATAVKELILR